MLLKGSRSGQRGSSSQPNAASSETQKRSLTSDSLRLVKGRALAHPSERGERFEPVVRRQ